jgi:hypothetical protein
MLLTGVGVEKVQFPPKQPELGGYIMSRKLRKSFVGHPDAILFLPISREGVFQQPQAITLTTGVDKCNGDDSPITNLDNLRSARFPAWIAVRFFWFDSANIHGKVFRYSLSGFHR